MKVRSWGNYPKVEHAAVIPLHWRHRELPRVAGSMLPAGLARSYGDSCLNEGGTLLSTTGLDRLIAFDRAAGVLRCEAGTTLAQILDLTVPAGWFLPVAPGTAQVSVGGAIANDVHGKNHHAAGSFGTHLRRFELARSDGTRLECTPDTEPTLFRATVGGLGLTGLITWAELQLRRVAGGSFEVETIRMEGLEHFFALSGSAGGFEYHVAWVDALARGADLGRGLFIRANHSEDPAPVAAGSGARLGIPFNLPASTLNPATVALFNRVYRARGSRDWRRTREPYSRYLFPLDGIAHWNRMYGEPGFVQHQSVVPRADAPSRVRALLEAVAAAGDASFLTVLKAFGDRPPEGVLSFPRPGVTLALDLPMRGAATLALMERLDAIVREAGGAIYPAKDARMSPETFRAAFPRWEELERQRDPAFSSSFWRRVTR